jgi:hypothetical protein
VLWRCVVVGAGSRAVCCDVNSRARGVAAVTFGSKLYVSKNPSARLRKGSYLIALAHSCLASSAYQIVPDKEYEDYEKKANKCVSELMHT